MRQVLSSVMLFILAFNWLGYDLVANLMNSSLHKEANHRIEQGNYNKGQLIEIKVDLELPYATDWTAFERIQGAVTYKGVVYNFVERKYENGQMVYRCLPNQRGTELQNARDYFQTLVYDMESQDQQDPAPNEQTAKKLSIETTVLPVAAYTFSLPVCGAVHPFWLQKACMNGFGFIPTQPPEEDMNVTV